jgi:chemotaxis receptor (MCP) glutamine deamidase CheD
MEINNLKTSLMVIGETNSPTIAQALKLENLTIISGEIS